MVRDLKAIDRGIAFSIFWLLFAAYLFTFTTLIDSSDGLSMFATVEQVATHYPLIYACNRNYWRNRYGQKYRD